MEADVLASGAPAAPSVSDRLAEMADRAGLTHIRMVAWRDLDDREAGGSELHAVEVAERWAAAGLDVTLRTSAVQGEAGPAVRRAVRLDRRSGRYGLFPRVVAEGSLRRTTPGTGLVEIWNGVPFLSPLWWHGPRIAFLHHVHRDMWAHVLGSRVLAAIGRTLETRLAPPLYRRTPIVTLSQSSKDDIIGILGHPKEGVTVVPPGISPRFTPGRRASRPLVLSVGRLAPTKHFDQLIRAVDLVRRDIPQVRLVIVGMGSLERRLRALVAELRLEDTVELVGRVGDDELCRLYQRAWLVASASSSEGWGMTLTEAAACGTPAVATAISGHRDAIEDGRSGLLVQNPVEMAPAIAQILADSTVRARLSAGAIRHAARYTWDATALGTFAVLAEDARRRAQG